MSRNPVADAASHMGFHTVSYLGKASGAIEADEALRADVLADGGSPSGELVNRVEDAVRMEYDAVPYLPGPLEDALVRSLIMGIRERETWE